jgi:hypothetical protein
LHCWILDLTGKVSEERRRLAIEEMAAYEEEEIAAA